MAETPGLRKLVQRRHMQKIALRSYSGSRAWLLPALALWGSRVANDAGSAITATSTTRLLQP
jgi:hypothetical protein